MTFMGEGSSNQGDVHEGLNFAAIHKLPFVLVIENNGYAISVPVSKELALPDVADRASGYGIPGVVVDGADVLGCYQASKEAVARARAGDGPTLIEAKVTRLTGHSSDDQQTKYRPAEELEAERTRDPLPKFREQLAAAGVLDDELIARIDAENKAVVDDATDYAEKEPDPDPANALMHVFAEGVDARPRPAAVETAVTDDSAVPRACEDAVRTAAEDLVPAALEPVDVEPPDAGRVE